jgi:hypothetical protein
MRNEHARIRERGQPARRLSRRRFGGGARKGVLVVLNDEINAARGD